jgi:hypothetical protein
LTLAIYAGKERCSVHCFAGCESDDVLAAVNLTFKDMYYARRDPRAIREAQQARLEQEAFEYRMRIRVLVEHFRSVGYTTYERDSTVACATAQIMAAKGERPHLKQLLAVHMERIIAAGIAGKLAAIMETGGDAR